jgi:dihydroorotase
MGVVGLETAFPALYTELVEPGQLSLEKLVALLCLNPRKRFHLPVGEDFTVFDLDAAYVIDPADFVSLGRATPFEGRTVHGKCLLTVCDGRVVWQDPEL